MILGVFLFASLFLSIAGELDTSNSTEVNFDTEETNSTDLHFAIITPNLLCPLCHSVIDGYKKQLQENPNFKAELLSSCEKLSKDDKDKLLICHENITDININKLRDMSTTQICLEQKFCAEGDKGTLEIIENAPPENMTIEAIPDIPNATLKRSKAPLSTSVAVTSGFPYVILMAVAVVSLFV
ncbi:hypothetical protein QR680_001318 [Steinernema hermaphroditum]|uniref:Saposin B-type domain-containing protein n=1 Tax=Steinernema hermaphroditum TaxID=289476 RepID=A0AA39GZP4_9BILA|nr:hypothetical protein QR680_001318 [Steinernema hermaphroditum]